MSETWEWSGTYYGNPVRSDFDTLGRDGKPRIQMWITGEGGVGGWQDQVDPSQFSRINSKTDLGEEFERYKKVNEASAIYVMPRSPQPVEGPVKQVGTPVAPDSGGNWLERSLGGIDNFKDEFVGNLKGDAGNFIEGGIPGLWLGGTERAIEDAGGVEALPEYIQPAAGLASGVAQSQSNIMNQTKSGMEMFGDMMPMLGQMMPMMMMMAMVGMMSGFIPGRR